MIKRAPDCPACYGPCDPEIHSATVRVHAWFRERLLFALEPVDISPKTKAQQAVTTSGFPVTPPNKWRKRAVA